jgi:hypothetical protein
MTMVAPQRNDATSVVEAAAAGHWGHRRQWWRQKQRDNKDGSNAAAAVAAAETAATAMIAMVMVESKTRGRGDRRGIGGPTQYVEQVLGSTYTTWGLFGAI